MFHINKYIFYIIILILFSFTALAYPYANCSTDPSKYLLYDDFNGTSLNASVWTANTAEGTVALSGGALVMQPATSFNNWDALSVATNISNATSTYTIDIFDFNSTWVDASKQQAMILMGKVLYLPFDALTTRNIGTDSMDAATAYLRTFDGTDTVKANSHFPTDYQHNITIQVTPTQFRFYVNGTLDSALNKFADATQKMYIMLRTGATAHKITMGKVIIYEGTECPTDATPFTPSTAAFVDPTPPDGDVVSNKSILINITCTPDTTRYIYFDDINPPQHIAAINSTLNISNNVTLEGTYYYLGACLNGSANTSTRHLHYDITAPLITINNNNFFSALNTSNITRKTANNTLSVQFVDNNQVFAYEINITNGTHTFYYNTTENFSNSNFYIASSSNTYCGQQFANVSTVCGGLATGGYNYTTQQTGINFAYDGDFNTEFTPPIDVQTYIYANFTIIPNSTEAYLEAKDGKTGLRTNYTIPARCMNQTAAMQNLTIKIYMLNNIGGLPAIWYYCADYNGKYLDALQDTEGNATLYDFKIHWNLANVTVYSYFNITNLAVNFSNWSINKNYYVSIGVSDAHTKKSISNYDTLIKPSAVRYITEHGIGIEITSLDTSVASTLKYSDRYKFSFEYGSKFYSEKKFKVTSNKKIIYLPKSNYKAHFVILGEGVKGNWLDFEGKYNPTVIKIDDYTYQVSIWTDDKKVTFDSIGGLNTRYENYYFYLTTTYPYNLQVQFADAKYSYTEDFTENVTLHNESQINLALNYSCTCTNCVIIGTSCRIPITFQSDNNALLTVQIVNISNVVGFDNCSSSFATQIPSNATALNVSVVDISDNLVEVLYESSTIYNTTNFSISVGTSNQTYCIYPSWANISTNTQFQYQYTGVFYNYFLDAFMINLTKYLTLRTQENTTLVIFNVVDADGDPLAGYRIQILKFDVGTGNYIVQEILETDSKGTALGNIELYNAFYNFLIYDTTNTLVLTETGVRITSTSYTFTISGITDRFYEDVDSVMGIEWTAYYNNDTKFAIFTFSDPSGTSQTGCLKVQEKNHTGTTLLSDACVSSAASTLSYAIPIEYNDTRQTKYVVTAYFKTNYDFLAKTIEIATEGIANFFVQDRFGSLFIALILIVIGILIGLPNPNISMVYFFAVLLVSFWLKLWFISLPVLGSIIILGIFILYTGGKQQ